MSSCLNKIVSSRDGFLFTESAAPGWGKAGIECSIATILKTSGDDHLGRRGGEAYNELRVV